MWGGVVAFLLAALVLGERMQGRRKRRGAPAALSGRRPKKPHTSPMRAPIARGARKSKGVPSTGATSPVGICTPSTCRCFERLAASALSDFGSFCLPVEACVFCGVKAAFACGACGMYVARAPLASRLQPAFRCHLLLRLPPIHCPLAAPTALTTTPHPPHRRVVPVPSSAPPLPRPIPFSNAHSLSTRCNPTPPTPPHRRVVRRVDGHDVAEDVAGAVAGEVEVRVLREVDCVWVWISNVLNVRMFGCFEFV